jgi:hypothetical protein
MSRVYKNDADRELAVALRKAKKLLLTPGKWSKGALARNAEGEPLNGVAGIRGDNAASFCAVGAVIRCGGKRSMNILDAAVFSYTRNNENYASPTDDIMAFNDGMISSPEELMPVFDIALDLLRAKPTSRSSTKSTK